MSNNYRSTNRGYPLSALFLLVTLFATLSAFVAIAARTFNTPDVDSILELLGFSIAECIIFAVLGIFVGLFHYRQLRGMLIGLLSGGVIGLFVGPILLVPTGLFLELVLVSIVGSIIIILVGSITRIGS